MIHRQQGVQFQERVSREITSYDPETTALTIDKRYEKERNTPQGSKPKGDSWRLVGNWEKMTESTVRRPH